MNWLGGASTRSIETEKGFSSLSRCNCLQVPEPRAILTRRPFPWAPSLRLTRVAVRSGSRKAVFQRNIQPYQ